MRGLCTLRWFYTDLRKKKKKRRICWKKVLFELLPPSWKNSSASPWPEVSWAAFYRPDGWFPCRRCRHLWRDTKNSSVVSALFLFVYVHTFKNFPFQARNTKNTWQNNIYMYTMRVYLRWWGHAARLYSVHHTDDFKNPVHVIPSSYIKIRIYIFNYLV